MYIWWIFIKTAKSAIAVEKSDEKRGKEAQEVTKVDPIPQHSYRVQGL